MGLSLKKLGSKIFDQINPLDNGRTFQQRTPVNNRSALQQAGHFAQPIARAASYVNPVGQAAHAVSAVAPHIPQFSANNPARFLNNLVINPVKSTSLHVNQLEQLRNPYHGSVKQQFGQAGQDAINIASVLPVGKGAQLLTKGGKVLPRVVMGAKGGAKIGAGFGAAQGLSTAAKDNLSLPQSLKTVGINTGVGAVGGTALGAGVPLVGAGAKAAVKAAHNIKIPQVKLQPLGQEGKFRLPNLGGQNLHYSSSNGRTTVSGKANQVRAQLTKLNQVGAVGKNVPSEEELKMGQALGMTPADVAKAKAETLAPPLTSIPKQAGAIEKVPQSMKPYPTKNPMTPGPLDNKVGFAPVQEGDVAQPHLNAQFVHDKLIEVGNVADKHVSNLSLKDQELMKSIQTKGVAKTAAKADNPTAFKQAEAALRNYYDTRIAYDHYHGIATPYRKNYLRDLIPDNPNGPANRAATGGDKAPGYTLAKEHPGNTGVLEGLRRDVRGAAYNHAKLTYAKGLEEAFPGQISRGSPIVGQEGVSKQLLTPYGQELFATKDLAQQVNRRAAPRPSTKVGKTYDTANSQLKYWKLGGGTFHGVTEAGNIGGQQAVHGLLHPSTIPSKAVSNARLVAGTFSKTAHEANMRGYANDASHYADGVSTLDRARIFGATLGERQILADVEVKGSRVTKVPIIHQVHEAIFKRQIPEAKLMTIKQLTQDLNIRNPADVAKGRAIAKAMNKIGGINSAVEGLTPETGKWLARGVLARDFTEGRWSTMISAVSKAGPEGNIARQMVIGKTLVYLLPTLAAATVAGKIDWNNPKDVATKIGDQILDPHFPTPFKTKTGIGKIAKTPETFVSEIGRLVKPVFDGSADKTAGIKHYGSARLAALPALGEQLATNQDYRGDPIAPRDENGKIKLKYTAANLGENSLPIPISQGIKVARGKQKAGEAVVNTLGLRSVADPTDPRMKSMNNSNKVLAGLSKDDQQKYKDAHGVRTDQYGNKATTVPAGNGAHNADILLQDLVHGKGSVVGAGAKIDAYNRKLGMPGDPFYKLTKDQQIAVLLMQQDKTRNPAESKNIYNQNKGWLDGYYNDRTAYFDKLHLPKSTKIQELPEPFADKQTSSDLTAMRDLSGAELGDFISSHPNVTDYFNKKSKWVNDNRTIEHRPELDTYPVFSPEVKQIQAEFSAVPKGGGKKGGNKYRADWIKANPGKYAKLGQAYTQSAIYGLEQDAAQAQYKNSEFSQKGLKDIVNLAKYDIGTYKDANGNTFYALGGGGSDGSGSGGSGYSKYAKGSGGGGSGKTPLPYGKAVSLNAGGKMRNPKVSFSLATPLKGKLAKATKPKVSIKKSKV